MIRRLVAPRLTAGPGSARSLVIPRTFAVSRALRLSREVLIDGRILPLLGIAAPAPELSYFEDIIFSRKWYKAKSLSVGRVVLDNSTVLREKIPTTLFGLALEDPEDASSLQQLMRRSSTESRKFSQSTSWIPVRFLKLLRSPAVAPVEGAELFKCKDGLELVSVSETTVPEAAQRACELFCPWILSAAEGQCSMKSLAEAIALYEAIRDTCPEVSFEKGTLVTAAPAAELSQELLLPKFFRFRDSEWGVLTGKAESQLRDLISHIDLPEIFPNDLFRAYRCKTHLAFLSLRNGHHSRRWMLAAEAAKRGLTILDKFTIAGHDLVNVPTNPEEAVTSSSVVPAVEHELLKARVEGLEMALLASEVERKRLRQILGMSSVAAQ